MRKTVEVNENQYRLVDEDGRRSYLYEKNDSFFFPDKCLEIAVHHEDGTTDAHLPDTSIYGAFVNDCLGEKKNKD